MSSIRHCKRYFKHSKISLMLMPYGQVLNMKLSIFFPTDEAHSLEMMNSLLLNLSSQMSKINIDLWITQSQRSNSKMVDFTKAI